MTEPSQYFKGRTVQEQMNEVIGYVDTRAAEVATTAIASDVAQVHQDMLDADADATAAAASAAAAAGTLANAVKKTGETSQSIAGNIEVSGTLKSAGTLYAVGDASVGGNLGVGGTANVGDLIATGHVTVPTPTANNYAANKKYVDDALDNYGPMVRTTDNQTIAGEKNFINPVFGDIAGVLIERALGYYKTHKIGTVSASTTGTWYINLIFSWRYGITIVHCEVVFNNGVITSITTVDLLGRTQSGSTKIAIDIIDNEAWVVVNRASQNNVFSRISIMDIQAGASSHPIWSRLNAGELYTPSGVLIEANLI